MLRKTKITRHVVFISTPVARRDMIFSEVFIFWLSFDVVCLVFLLLPNGNCLTPLNFLSNFACTGLLSLIFYKIFTSDMDIGIHTLICGNWADVCQFFGILLFTFIPIVKLNILYLYIYVCLVFLGLPGFHILFAFW